MNPRNISGAVALLAIPVISISLVSISQGGLSPGDLPVAMQRLTPAEIVAAAAKNPPTTTGIQMTNLIGDPSKPGLYTVRVAIAAHTQAQPHTHLDNRAVTVLSGTWHMGYGAKFDATALKDLPPGSVYTEPSGQPHFAQTADEPVVILVTGYGPSNTRFVTN